MLGSNANGSWENYSMLSEHKTTEHLFLNNFIKMVFFFEIFDDWMTILDAV
jgi:hypothetical protein